jgi:curved DNA-binding protein CbpA
MTMQRSPDPYRLLGVGRDATTREIKAAHRRLAKRFHPDAPQADEGAFLSVQGAYELLSDPLRRTEWDRSHAPGPVRADEALRGARSRDQDRPGRAGTTAGTTTGSERAARSGRRGEAPPRTARPAASPASGAARAARGTAPGPGAAPDPDPFSRSSGAAWSSASRAYFRRASADMPSGAANPNTPRWTTPLGGTPPPRYAPAGGPPPAEAGDRRAPRHPDAVVPHDPAPAWPNLIQRAESGLMAALPLVALTAYAGFNRFGPRGAEVAAVIALIGFWAGLMARPRAAWLGAWGAVGALLGLGVFVLLGALLPAETPVIVSFLVLVITIAGAYAVAMVLALRDWPVRRPWLPAPGGPA